MSYRTRNRAGDEVVGLEVGDDVEVDPKKPWLSKRFWGSVVAILSAGASVLFGREVSEALSNDTLEWIMKVIGLVSGGVALYGGWTANRPLGTAMKSVKIK